MLQVFGVVVLVVLSGCFRLALVDGTTGNMEVKETKVLRHGLLGGIVELSEALPLQELCPNGFAQVQHKITFVNGLVSALTQNIYFGSTAFVQCRGGASYLLELNEDGHAIKMAYAH